MTVQPVLTETVYELLGATLGPFNTVWPYEDPTNVTVYLDRADGAGSVLLVENTDYFVTASNPTLTNGGEVTLAAEVLTTPAWNTGAQVALQRLTPRNQPSAFGEAVGFSPQASEQALDHVERQVQELVSALGRALVFGYGPGNVAPEGTLAIWTNDAHGELRLFPYGGSVDMLVGTDANGNLTLWPKPAPVSAEYNPYFWCSGGPLVAGQVLFIHKFEEAVTYGADFAGFQGGVSSVGTPPAAAYPCSVLKNGVSIGTLTYNTNGSCTPATAAHAAGAFAIGDEMLVVGATPADGSIQNFSGTFAMTAV